MKHTNNSFLISLILLLGITNAFAQSKLYVNNSSGFGGDGSSWIQAYKYLQDALAEAQSINGDIEIYVAKGTYYPDINASSHPNQTDDRNSSFNLSSDLTIYGGYNNVAPHNRDLDNFETILSGNIDDPNTNTDNSFHVVFAENVGDVVLDGLIVEKGYANELENGYGGGILIDNSNLSITNSIFRNNESTHSGGGVIINGDQSTVNINDCEFISNKTLGLGSAIYTFTGTNFTVNISDSWFYKNGDLNTLGSSGGAIANGHGGNFEISNCIFEENEAPTGGAAKINSTTKATFSECKFIKNQSEYGGAIHFDHNFNDIVLSNCNFDQNQALESGGAVYLIQRPNNFEKIIQNSTFKNNSAKNGGAIYCDPSNLLLLNNIFHDNEASETGGAIYFNEYEYSADRIFKVINSTLYDNIATQGAGIALTSGKTSPFEHVKIVNSILWSSSSNDSQIWEESNIGLNVSYSCIKGGYSGGQQIITSNPSLTSDFHLNPDSPCINAGTTTGLNLPLYDFEGDNRIIGSNVDMGADEARMIIYVDENADGDNTGATWEHAYVDFQSALDIATANHQIWVADGIYKPSQPISKDEKEYRAFLQQFEENERKNYPNSFEEFKSDPKNYTFYINKSLEIYGGFDGGNTNETSIEERNWNLYQAILSGDVGNEGVISDNCKRVVHISLSPLTLIDGFTIRDGYHSPGYDPLEKAALRIERSTAKVQNCKFTNNNVLSIFISNMINGDLITTYVNGCTFENNPFQCISVVAGCELKIASSTFKNNSSSSCTIGGASCDITLDYVNISDNTTENSGGGLNILTANCIINHSIISNNNINYISGMQQTKDPFEFGGAAILNRGSNLEINFTTIADNLYNGITEGIKHSEDFTSNSTTIRNSILWSSQQGDQLTGDTSEFDVQFSDIQLMDANDIFNGEGNINENPEFVGTNDFHLMTTGKSEFLPPIHKWVCSPCIDTGDPNEQSIEPDNSRVNMGRYGNTSEAAGSCSKSEKLTGSDQIISIMDLLEVNPNPFTDRLNITHTSEYSGQTDISILNSNGQVVYTKLLHSTANQPSIIQWNGQDQNGRKLKPGIYLVRISNARFSTTKKVILRK